MIRENTEIEIVNLKVYLCTKGIIQGICLKTVLSQMNMNLITGSSPVSRGGDHEHEILAPLLVRHFNQPCWHPLHIFPPQQLV